MYTGSQGCVCRSIYSHDLPCLLIIYLIALGPLDPAIDLNSLGPLHLGTFDKTTFSMITPQVQAILEARPSVDNVVLFGIEVRTPRLPFPERHLML